MQKKLWLLAGFVIIIYIVMGVYADFGKLSESISLFKWQYAIIMLVLTTIGYFVRYIKWHYFLKAVDVNLTHKQDLFVFFSGMIMTISPGKLGEVWKGWIIRDIAQYPLSKTIPIVIADRIVDIISLICLSLFGIFYYTASLNLLIPLFVMCLIGYLALNSKRITNRVIYLIDLYLSKYTHDIKTMHSTLVSAMKPKIIIPLIILNTIAWFCECLGLYYIIVGFGISQNILLSTFIFSFSSLVGGLSMIPGGIGVAEASITGLLIQSGISSTLSVAIAMILRLGSFWYGAILGFVVYSLFNDKIKRCENVESSSVTDNSTECSE